MSLRLSGLLSLNSTNHSQIKLTHHESFGRTSTSLPPRPVIYLSISILTTILNLYISRQSQLAQPFVSCFPKATLTVPPSIVSQDKPTLTSITVKEDEVYHLLSRHKTDTATGPDGISGHMLRNTTISIYPALTRFFNISLTQQKFPLAWKTSNVNPIPKSSDLSHCSNYRPISLLSLLSKILKRIVHNHVFKFLSKHNLLSRVQFSFRSHSSTQEALLSVTNTWQTMLSKHKLIAAVFLDSLPPLNWNSRFSPQLV